MKAKLRLCLQVVLLCALALDAAGFAAGPLTAKAPSPQRVVITPVLTRMEKGDTAQLSVQVLPSGARQSIRWSSSDRKVATVDQNGLVTAVKTGSVRIRAASKVKPSVYKKLYIKVVDSQTVTGVVIENDGGALLVGTTMTLTARVLPATASQQVTWSSDKPGVADVSPAGVVTGYDLGSAIIKAEAGGFSARQRVVVLDAEPVSSLPSQVTHPNSTAIRENLEKIEGIKEFAKDEIDRLSVTSSEKTSRRKTIDSAFRMASFPWVSKRSVKYWSGSSRYVANAVYFGIPYTQTNRTFNDKKILNPSFGAFKLTGDYYTATLKNKTYPGNDCSSFVSMSIWGRGSSYSYLRSRDIYKSSIYRTVATRSNLSGYQNLRPGDLFVRDGHVAMFLYFTDSCRSRVMIIQQGGLKSLNTVSCTIKPLSYYSGDKWYIARRKKSYA